MQEVIDTILKRVSEGTNKHSFTGNPFAIEKVSQELRKIGLQTEWKESGFSGNQYTIYTIKPK